MHQIRLLTPAEADVARPDLVDLLLDCVDGGASVNFVQPMTREKSEGWWAGALASHARAERLILIAEENGRIDGSVQLVPAGQENQPHRADIAKLLVHRRARRNGLGAALMQAAETEAKQRNRTLLTLDTEADSAGERLYQRLGWTRFGQVPGYAVTADGTHRQTCSFYFKLL